MADRNFSKSRQLRIERCLLFLVCLTMPLHALPAPGSQVSSSGTAPFILDDNRTITLPCIQDIPLGHKVALQDMNVGDTVIKYGVDIGKVVAPIKTGQHAHVHNIKTKRW